MSVTYIPTALRNLIHERAEGLCEYCLISESVSFAKHQIDHVIAEKHGGQTVEENLALSCAICNKYKAAISLQLTVRQTESFRFLIREQTFGASISELKTELSLA